VCVVRSLDEHSGDLTKIQLSTDSMCNCRTVRTHPLTYTCFWPVLF